MATPGDSASLNTIAASLASLTATVASVQGQISETRQDMRDVKASLSTLVPRDVHDVQMRDLTARVGTMETRQNQYVTMDVFVARAKAEDGDFAEIRDTLKVIPDVRRQNMALWLAGAAVFVAGSCGILSVVVNALVATLHR